MLRWTWILALPACSVTVEGRLEGPPEVLVYSDGAVAAPDGGGLDDATAEREDAAGADAASDDPWADRVPRRASCEIDAACLADQLCLDGRCVPTDALSCVNTCGGLAACVDECGALAAASNEAFQLGRCEAACRRDPDLDGLDARCADVQEGIREFFCLPLPICERVCGSEAEADLLACAALMGDCVTICEGAPDDYWRCVGDLLGRGQALCEALFGCR